MKLRIHGNAIRLRLTISEVERLAAGAGVSATVGLAPVKFTYELNAGRVESVAVRFAEGRLSVSIPLADAEELARSGRIGVRTGGGAVPRVSIEKDFGCAKPRPGEDLSDLYGYAAAL